MDNIAPVLSGFVVHYPKYLHRANPNSYSPQDSFDGKNPEIGMIEVSFKITRLVSKQDGAIPRQYELKC